MNTQIGDQTCNNTLITISKIKELRLHGMVSAFPMATASGNTDQYTIDEFLTHLVDAEWNDRNERKRVRLTRAVAFRYQASVAELDYTEKRNLDKSMMLRLSDGRWITEGKDILITGATGLGKSFIGSALGIMPVTRDITAEYRVFDGLSQRGMVQT